MKAGYTIFYVDDSLSPKVKSVGAGPVMTEPMDNCELRKRKNCNFSGMNVDLPVLHDKETNDLFNFGILQGVESVAASLVQSAADVALVLEKWGRIIAFSVGIILLLGNFTIPFYVHYGISGTPSAIPPVPTPRYSSTCWGTSPSCLGSSWIPSSAAPPLLVTFSCSGFSSSFSFSPL